MTSKQRLLAAIERKIPDRLPVTTHHVMGYFLDTYLNGISNREFFDVFGLDAILWAAPHKPGSSRGEYADPTQKELGFLESVRIVTDQWRIEVEELPSAVKTTQYRFVTPRGVLSEVLQFDEHTAWVTEHLVKEKKDIELIAGYATSPTCDVEQVNMQADAFGERGIIRGHICVSDVYGQPGCWQDAACLFGIERLILEAHDDPAWVHEFLTILRDIAAMQPDAMETFTPPAMGGDVDLVKARQILGDGECMIGGFDQFHFFQGCSPEMTRAEVKRCFQAAGKNGGYILSSSDHFFDADVELIAAYADQAKRCTYR